MREMPWPRIGWRNLGRNPRRTLLTALGLAVGFFAVVFMIGWMRGITAELVENATSLVSGQIEIHDAEYRPDRSMYDTLGGREGVDVEAMLRTIDADEAVVAAAPRVYAGGLVSSGEATSAGTFMGVDPEREVALTRFLDPLVAGRLPEPGRNELLIGDEMGRQIGAGLGDELVLVGAAADGSMANDLFTVAGIFRTGLVEFDARTAVLAIGDLQALIYLDPDRIHEIAVATADPAAADEAAARLAAALEAGSREIEVASWTVLNPVLVDYVGLAESVYWIFIVIIFAIASFGIANTMLMATFERRREFAVMLALGATPRAIVGTVLSEALAVGVLSLAIGSAVTFPLMVWWATAPPSLAWLFGSVTLQGALLEPSLRVGYDLPGWTLSAFALLLTAVLAALYPAAKAARVPPADTLSGL
jgi:ABC-type lipoprotein release transport system permease subunit